MASQIHSELLTHGDESDRNHDSKDYECRWSTGSSPEEEDYSDDDDHQDGMVLFMFGLPLRAGKHSLFDDEDDQQQDCQCESGDDTDGGFSDKKMNELTGAEDDGVSDSGSKFGDQDWSADLGSTESPNTSREETRERSNRKTQLEKVWEMKCKVVRLMGCANGIREENKDDGYDGDSLCAPGSVHGDHHDSMATIPEGCILAMAMDEMKACKELGFEVKMSPFRSIINNCTWISGPGADPSVVKARLKVWAQLLVAASIAQVFG